MKVVSKFSIVLVCFIGVLLAEHARRWTARDTQVFEADMMRDHRVIGRLLQVQAREQFATDANAAAHLGPWVAVANETSGNLRVDWLPPEAVQQVMGGAGEPETARELQHLAPTELTSLFPVVVKAKVHGAIRVRESLEERDRFASAARTTTLLSLATLLAVSGVLALLLGRWLVGEPVRQLVDKARKVGQGDLGSPLRFGRKDELGELAAEMNAMCDAIEKANGSLEAEARARASAQEQLRRAERLATVGKLASGIAHELGTPLSVVAGHAQMIAAGEVSGEAVARSAQIIDREAARMAGIVRQLLDFARRKAPEGGSSDAARVVRETLTLMEPMARKNRVDQRLEVPDIPVLVQIEAASLQQVILNIGMNAHQSMTGGGTLTVCVNDGRDADASRPESWVEVRVHDTGAGIAEQDLPHIFEPFFTTKPVGAGTGLGLSVVHGIVEDHGGRIEVRSNPGDTTFSVYLHRAAS